MRQIARVSRLAMAGLLLSGVEGWAQDSGSLVSSFSNVLIGVSALLVAVSFAVVMVKVARLIDLASKHYEAHDSSDEH